MQFFCSGCFGLLLQSVFLPSEVIVSAQTGALPKLEGLLKQNGFPTCLEILGSFNLSSWLKEVQRVFCRFDALPLVPLL